VFALTSRCAIFSGFAARAAAQVFQNLTGPKERANLERSSKKHTSKKEARFIFRIFITKKFTVNLSIYILKHYITKSFTNPNTGYIISQFSFRKSKGWLIRWQAVP
jgi:hypothetical protein